MFAKVLVANRGEIARRIIATCQQLGIRTVAVYSPADLQAPHRIEADEAVLLSSDEPAGSYLDTDSIIDAARRTGAEAVHPGYGFLSENPAFAKACRDAGLVFVGPPPEVLQLAGDKARARQAAARAGVEPVPGTLEPTDDTAALSAEALKIGFPVLVKAAGGGGGKGIRRIEGPRELSDALERASSEARAAFGDGRLYLEKLLVRPRHVEVQILADHHGNVVHLYERECSLQRRYQKIIEESPAPALPEELRRGLQSAALAVAREVGYENAGTVEFLVTGDGGFYFLEINARLQVEHPVTEMTCGVDLVEEQLRIAAGQRLSITQEKLRQSGHAIECRIVAEDPASGWRPCPGRIERVFIPRGPGIRVDSGIEDGSVVSPFYDPLLVKLVCWGTYRRQAVNRALWALERTCIAPVETNTGILQEVLRHDDFLNGSLDTAWLERFSEGWFPERRAVERLVAGWLLGELSASRQSTGPVAERVDDDPWDRLSGWRMERD